MFYDVFNMFNRFKTHNLKYKSVIDKYPNTNSIIGEPFIDKNGARIYEWENSDGVRFRAVVGDILGKAPTTAVGSKNGLALRERIITFDSDRNLNEPMNFKNPKLNQNNTTPKIIIADKKAS